MFVAIADAGLRHDLGAGGGAVWGAAHGNVLGGELAGDELEGVRFELVEAKELFDVDGGNDIGAVEPCETDLVLQLFAERCGDELLGGDAAVLGFGIRLVGVGGHGVDFSASVGRGEGGG